MAFPIQRLRRLRQHESLRRMVRETRLSPSDLIYPLFVMEGKDQRREIASMPGQFRLSIDLLVKEAGEVAGWAFLRLCCSAFPIARTSAAHRATIRTGLSSVRSKP